MSSKSFRSAPRGGAYGPTPSRRELLICAAIAAATPLGATPKNEISLAAWSLVQSFYIAKRWTNLELPRIARDQFAIGAVELVSHFFDNPSLGYLRQLLGNGRDSGVKFVRIMVDDEGELAAIEKSERIQAAIAHRRWIDAAHYLGCIDIRASMRGGLRDWKTDKDLVKRGAEGFRRLLEYARGANLGILIEPHGGASSDPDVLLALMKEVDDPRFGILVDLINISREVDYEQGLRKLLPSARGISVHPMWTEEGGDPGFDMNMALKLCLESGFSGYWGIESAFGPRLPLAGPYNFALRKPEPLPPESQQEQIWQNESKGVRLTKAILERVVFGKGEPA